MHSRLLLENLKNALRLLRRKNFLSAEQIAALQKITTLEQGVADNKTAAANNKTAIGQNTQKITNLQLLSIR